MGAIVGASTETSDRTYRLAYDPNAGRKALTLQTVPVRTEQRKQAGGHRGILAPNARLRRCVVPERERKPKILRELAPRPSTLEVCAGLRQTRQSDSSEAFQ